MQCTVLFHAQKRRKYGKKEPRKGCQTSAKSIILPYAEIRGQEAVDLYTASGRTAQEWQELLTYDLLAVNKDGPWVHTRFVFLVLRRNGKKRLS